MRALTIGRPVWLTGPPPADRYPALKGRPEVDVAVVGGGITGASVAAVFAEAGVSVALLEADRVGRGSTAASTALLLREPDAWLGELGRRYGAARARRIWQLSAGAVGDFTATLRRLGVDCALQRSDAVYYTLDKRTVGPLRAELERRRRDGFAGEWLTPGALRRLTALPGQGAIRTSGGAQLDPYRACQGLTRAAAGAGAAVYERSPVRRIRPDRTGVRLDTPRGSVRAAQVVIATGYATPQFRPLAGRFRLTHTYVLATEPLDRHARRELGLGGVMLWDTERPYHYARWTPDRRLLLGGADRPLASGAARAAAFREGRRALLGYWERVLPGLSAVRVDRAWEGMFALTPDGLPYIGPHRLYPRHLFALGYGGNGMSFAFLAARMLLQRWQGAVGGDHDLFAFGRHR